MVQCQGSTIHHSRDNSWSLSLCTQLFHDDVHFFISPIPTIVQHVLLHDVACRCLASSVPVCTLTSDGDWALSWAAIPLRVVTVAPWRSGFGSACWTSHHRRQFVSGPPSLWGPLLAISRLEIDPVRLFKCLFVCIHACPGLNFVRLPKSREPAHPSYPLTNCRLLPILVEASRFWFGRRGPFCISHCCWLGRQTAVPTHIRPPSITRASPLPRRLITTGQSTFSQQPASTRHALSPVPAVTRPHLHLQPSNLV